MNRITEGSPEPLGLALDETGANVAVFSAHAETIELCLFDGAGREIERIRLSYRTGDVHHAHVAGLKEGQRYGLRAHGPFDPERGHRFNGAILLVDPWALALDRPFALHPSMFAYEGGGLSQKHGDSAPFTPKAIAARLSPAKAARPQTAWRDTIIYEAHVRGFTQRHPGVPPDLRGTFAGLAHDAAIAHVKRLGVTTIELMPCAAWIDERHLAKLGLTNYWGYNPIAMMAPDPRLAPGGWAEVRACVDKLHAAGLEVIIDVVLNHTGEGDELGPTVSLRGLDNASFYRLRPDNARYYVNDAGCGNILACDRAIVVRYMMDALRAWALYGGVDGFRFDLATTLARRPDGFDPEAPFLAAISQDPLLRKLKLIAEPWDIGPGGYQVGNFPTDFGEWNDRFRDCARRFWRGGDIGVSELATRLSGSADLFHKHRRPSRSVNFITAHDGFTLADLVSYSHKHNEANGEENRDGTNDNCSWNNGAEGEIADAGVNGARARDQRNLLATLLLARGAPMLSMGAELGQTQGGNNNAYCQDSEIAWLDWSRADAALIAFTSKLIALRKANAALTRDWFLEGAAQDAALIPDVEWLTPSGAPMSEADWRDPHVATLVASLYAPAEKDGEADRVAVIIHRGAENIAVTPPAAREGFAWRVALTTSGEASRHVDGAATIDARSVALLVEEVDRHAARRDGAVTPALLASLAQAAGIAAQWRDVDGAEHEVPRETLVSLLERMGYPASTFNAGRDSLAQLAEIEGRRALPQSLVLREGETASLRLFAQGGRAPARLLARLEDGSAQAIAIEALEPIRWRGLDGRMNDGLRARLPQLPPGRHILSLEGGETACRLTVAPARCYTPQNFTGGFGLAAQLYSLRREGDQGLGDFTTLSQLARLSAQHGAAILALNPLHALFAQDRERASPYYPSDRRFLDPLYVDLRNPAAYGVTLSSQEEAAIAALAGAKNVAYPNVHALKTKVLQRAFAAFDDLTRRQPSAGAEFIRFIEQSGDALFRFACFEAIGEAHGGDWRKWPQELREGRRGALEAFGKAHEKRLRYHQFLQFLCETQLAGAAKDARDAGLALGFCRDLAVGAAPEGAESWSKQASLLEGFSVGAPPDAFCRDGQVWGLPPAKPLAWKADGCAEFAELAAANMRHAGALRIDHVMGLARLFVVPNGAKASEGAYLSYPLDDLLGQLALESERATCLAVGEDLGTLPWGFREKLDAADVLSYRVIWFEREGAGFAPPAHYAKKAMACVSTHDLPTLEGWWAGADIAEKAALGIIGREAAEAETAARAADKRALLAALRREAMIDSGKIEVHAFDDALAHALHAFAAQTPSLLAMAQIDDLASETTAVNLPGTDRERPNWRRKLTPPLPQLFENPRARAILAGLRRNLV